MLDDAHFFIAGFMKGPVCRGSIALSVIDDHFWVVFSDPDGDPLTYLFDVADNLAFVDSAASSAVWIFGR